MLCLWFKCSSFYFNESLNWASPASEGFLDSSPNQPPHYSQGHLSKLQTWSHHSFIENPCILQDADLMTFGNLNSSAWNASWSWFALDHDLFRPSYNFPVFKSYFSSCIQPFPGIWHNLSTHALSHSNMFTYSSLCPHVEFPFSYNSLVITSSLLPKV